MAGNKSSGRKRLPSNIHVLQGSKPSSSKADGVVTPPVAIPDAPDFLTDDALEEWNRVTPLLEAMGIIAEVYRASLTIYCQAWGRYVNAERQLKALGERGLIEVTPNGFRQMGVYLQISNRAAEQMKSAASEFGMTPSAISRVTGASAQGDMFGFGDGKPKGPGRFF